MGKTTNLNWWTPDFWTINNSIPPFKHTCFYAPKLVKPICQVTQASVPGRQKDHCHWRPRHFGRTLPGAKQTQNQIPGWMYGLNGKLLINQIPKYQNTANNIGYLKVIYHINWCWWLFLGIILILFLSLLCQTGVSRTSKHRFRSLSMHSDIFRWPMIEAQKNPFQVEHRNFSVEPS